MPVMALTDEVFLSFGSPYRSSHAVGKPTRPWVVSVLLLPLRRYTILCLQLI